MRRTKGKVTLRLTNSSEVAKIIVLEPWAGEYTLPPGKSYEIVASGDLQDPLEIEMINDDIVIYSFDSAGAMLTIYSDGKELKSE